eukprot:1157850-Pelagomonas_calceolata.AAC.2
MIGRSPGGGRLKGMELPLSLEHSVPRNVKQGGSSCPQRAGTPHSICRDQRWPIALYSVIEDPHITLMSIFREQH